MTRPEDNQKNDSEMNWPEWVDDWGVWRSNDQRDFLIVMKAYERFLAATGDAKLSAVLVMSWATLQTIPKGTV